MNRLVSWRLGSFLSAVLLLLMFSGCQAVNGVDVGKAMTDSWNVKSFEGEQQITLEFSNDGQALPVNEGTMDWSVLNKAKLSITNWKQQDDDHSSFDGQLVYGKDKSVSFKGSFAKGQLVLKVNGASAPIVLEMSTLMGGGSSSTELPVDPTSLLTNSKVTNILMPYVFTNMPNPKAISVSAAASEKVHGESLTLQNIHAEFSGQELAGMLQTMIGGMLSDEAGTKELLGQVLKALGMDFGGVAGNIVYGFVHDMIVKFQEDLTKDPTGIWKDVLDSKTKLTTDFYVDNNLNVRKSNWSLALPLSDNPGFNMLKLSGTTELWNLGKPVQAAMIEPDKAGVTWGKNGKMPQIVKLFGKDSAAYDLLMNDLHVARKSISMEMMDNSGGDEDHPLPYINDDGFTVVPVRFVSEKLDADVEWNGEKQEVTITNGWTGQKLVLTIGSSTAVLDGKPFVIGDGDTTTKAELTHSTTYVPVRFIAEQLFGAKVGFSGGDTKVVTIVKPAG